MWRRPEILLLVAYILSLSLQNHTCDVQGMVLVDSSLHPKASWEFDADIAILTHSTTIAPKYQAVIHCEIVRQAARVVAMDRERLRSGDREPSVIRASLLTELLTRARVQTFKHVSVSPVHVCMFCMPAPDRELQVMDCLQAVRCGSDKAVERKLAVQALVFASASFSGLNTWQLGPVLCSVRDAQRELGLSWESDRGISWKWN